MTIRPSNPILDAALAYAAAGIPVFPCDPQPDPPGTPASNRRAKRPLVPGAEKDAEGRDIPKTGGLYRATTNLEQLLRWWRIRPNALIGMPTGAISGILVIDLDPHGETVAETEARLIAAVGPLPACPRVRTQSGGLHLYFRMPAGAEAPRNSAKRLKSIDWRADGGYVIVPPSVMLDGKAYAWVVGRDEVDLPEPPPALLDLVMQRGAFARENRRAAGGADGAKTATSSSKSVQHVGDDPGERQVRLYGLATLDRARGDVAGCAKGGRGHELNAAAYGVAPLVALGVLSEREVHDALMEGAEACGLVATDGAQECAAKIRRGLASGAGNTAALSARLDGIRREAAERQARGLRRPEPPPIETVPDWVRAGSEDADGPGEDGDGDWPDADPGICPPIDTDDVDMEVVASCARLDTSDTDNGTRLIRHFGRDLLVLQLEEVQNKGYVVWDGTHWDIKGGLDASVAMAQKVGGRIMLEAEFLEHTPEESRVMEQSVDALRSKAREALEKAQNDAVAALDGRKARRRGFGVTSKNAGRIAAMLSMAAPHLMRPVHMWNADPRRFACLSHTIAFVDAPDPANPAARITKRVVTPGHRREDLITQVVQAVYDPTASCPGWMAFLAEFLPDEAVRLYVQIFCGLGLTGLPLQKLLFHYGLGANGKSVFLEVLCRIFGDLAVTLASETVSGTQERSGQSASPDLARLYGKRFCRVPELPAGVPVREDLVKKLTGGEQIQARNLFKGIFDFTPTAKPHWSGNGYPRIDGTDLGIWRRIDVIHWPVTIAEDRRRDFNEVVDELIRESSGILNWLIDGAMLYFERGLIPPATVRGATRDYQDEMDPVGKFVRSCVRSEPGGKVTGREMYKAYEAWSYASGLRPVSETRFGTVMKTKLTRIDGNVRVYVDVALADVPTRPRIPVDDDHGDRHE